MDKAKLTKGIFRVYVYMCLAVLLALSVGSVIAEEQARADNFGEMFTKGKAYLNFRYRYEYVDQDGISEQANASTLRSRLGFKTAEYEGFMAHLEAEDVHALGNDEYNSTTNGRTEYPIVADPEGTEINQAYLQYKLFEDTVVKGGRHTLILDNARFIGDVGWRQNNQTHDGATVVNTSIDDTKIFYGYTATVNRIFGEDSPMGEFDSDIHMLNVRNSSLDFGSITGFGYFLDLEDAPALSTATYGARFDGKTDLSEDVNFLYDLSYAHQQDHGDNPADYSASYFRVEPGISFGDFTFKAGFESLGSDDGMAGFSTPLATLHAHNGWADKFLATPDTGLEDAYGLVNYKVSDTHEYLDGLNITVVYHDFSAEEGSADYGTEWDVNISKKIADFIFGIKYANYEADTFATDTEKLMFSITRNFSQ